MTHCRSGILPVSCFCHWAFALAPHLGPESSLPDPGTAAPETPTTTQKMLRHHVPRCPAFLFVKFLVALYTRLSAPQRSAQ